MPTQTLLAQNYIYFSYHFQRKFLGVNTIRFYVESELPIDTLIFDIVGFQGWRNSQVASSYGGFRNATMHRQEFVVPRDGDWYLVINNSGLQPTAIHYEVS